jgi:hypothetical protein
MPSLDGSDDREPALSSSQERVSDWKRYANSWDQVDRFSLNFMMQKIIYTFERFSYVSENKIWVCIEENGQVQYGGV